jgi:hypothetical protein
VKWDDDEFDGPEDRPENVGKDDLACEIKQQDDWGEDRAASGAECRAEIGCEIGDARNAELEEAEGEVSEVVEEKFEEGHQGVKRRDPTQAARHTDPELPRAKSRVAVHGIDKSKDWNGQQTQNKPREPRGGKR